MAIIFLIILIGLSSIAVFFLSRRKMLLLANASSVKLSSLPGHYGYCTVLWSAVPALIAGIIFYVNTKHSGFGNYLAIIVPAALLSLLAFLSIRFLSPNFKARKHIEKWLNYLLIFCTFISVSITFLILISVLFESLRFFEKIPVTDFLFGLQWSPQTALRDDQAGSSGSFGAIPVFLGTILITIIAMCIAIPLGLLSAIYLSEYSSEKARNYIKPVLEVLAGIPTVVYGYFAAITFAPSLRDIGNYFGFGISSESAMAAGVIMGIMIIPFVLSLSDDVMSAVPKSLRDASLGLGATKSETIKKVVIPAALPGITGAILLAVSRAIGETMIVVMAAGMAANLTLNPFESVTAATVQIVSLLVGDQEFDSEKTLAAFALSLTLFVITLILNIIALIIVRKYREKYE